MECNSEDCRDEGCNCTAGDLSNLHRPLWHRVNVNGDPRRGRSEHSADVVGSNQIYIFGGKQPKGTRLNDLHVLDINQMQWRRLYLEHGPSTRSCVSYSK